MMMRWTIDDALFYNMMMRWTIDNALIYFEAVNLIEGREIRLPE